MALSWNEIKDRALKFSKEWENETSEDAEAKSFLDGFFNIFGVSRKRFASFEQNVKKAGGKDGFIDLLWKGVILIEMKSKGKDLDKAYKQAIDYFPGLKEYDLPKYILVCDFHRFRLYDIEENIQHEFELKELIKNVKLFGFIAGYQTKTYKSEDPVNIEAAERMGKLHDKLKAVGYQGHPLEQYLVRILFCLFAEDTSIFEKRLFQDYIEDKTAEDGSDLAAHLSQLFYILNTPIDKRLKNLDEHLTQFPYVNGRLFEEQLPPASFDSSMREAILYCCALDWSKISPAIFGSLFQSVMNPKERRNLGAHYTSEKNIFKLIKPLFLDELHQEFESLKTNKNKLAEFHKKLSTLKFLDPACGCGNFLIITYRELRLLEIEVIKILQGKQTVTDINSLINVSVDQFYGIEYEEFPARIAEVAMWLIDHQMNMRISEEFGQYFIRLPLKKSATIFHGNALHLNWQDLLILKQNNSALNSPLSMGDNTNSPLLRGDGGVSLSQTSTHAPHLLRGDNTTHTSPLLRGEGGVSLSQTSTHAPHLLRGDNTTHTSPLLRGEGGVSLSQNPTNSGVSLPQNPKRKIIAYNPNLKELARNLRNNSTKSEIYLWKYLKGRYQNKYDFHRQKPLGNYIVDFFCHELMLAIELDGITHHQEETVAKDTQKEIDLNALGVNVVRFSDEDVLNHTDGVLTFIDSYITGVETKNGSALNYDGTKLNTFSKNELILGNVPVTDTPLNPLSSGDLHSVQYNYILGNPPFVGKSLQNKEQKADMARVFSGVNGAGVLDYVTAWYIKAAQIIQNTQTKVAFVSTNSISQGEQVGILWNLLYNHYHIKIHFAHRTFSWSNEAKSNAAVHVVIIGFAAFNTTNKSIFEYEDIKSEPHEIVAKNINPYLLEGKDNFVIKRRKPICHVPEMILGNMPRDGGFLLLEKEDKEELIKAHPLANKYIKRYIGSQEFINNLPRWCLWLIDANPEEIKTMGWILKRIESVKESRLNSEKEVTRKLAQTPSLFAEIRQPKSNFLVIPEVSSERRKYVPIGYLSKDVITSNKLYMVPNAKLYHVGVLNSEMHNAWIRHITGRMKSDISYSSGIVYNNFPWPQLSPFEGGKGDVQIPTPKGDVKTSPQKADTKTQAIEAAAQKVLDVRAEFPNSSLADLYDPLTMPPALVKAHNELDKAVDLAYRPQPFTSEAKRMEFLFELYEKYTADLFTKSKKMKVKNTIKN